MKIPNTEELVHCLWLTSVLVALTMCGAAATCAAPPSPAPAVMVNPGQEKIQSVAVDALMKAPDSYKGTVRLRGVVTSVFPEKQKLGLLDAVYLTCCPSPCGGPQALPVTWAGDMPPVRSLVLVTGEVRRSGEKLEFVARSIDRLRQADGGAK